MNGASGRRAIPLAELESLARGRRRSVAWRGVAVASLCGLAAALVLAARSPAQDAGARATGAASTTVVVLDVSGSISTGSAGTIVRTLQRIGRGGGHAGLVLFSDDTEEVVPPTAPAKTLLDYVRLFRPSSLAANPWSYVFSAGTQIGRGLAAARSALARADIANARVVLVSDLEDGLQDMKVLRRELLEYARAPGLRLEVAPVPGYNVDLGSLFTRVLGRHTVDPEEKLGSPAASAPAAVAGSPAVPLLAVAVVAGAALLLAALELLNAPLAWKEQGA
jgi:VWA domain containing CoxE-like protein